PISDRNLSNGDSEGRKSSFAWRAIVKCCGRRLRQAASVCSTPSTNRTPAMTFDSNGDPFSNRQVFEAPSISLNTIVRQATLDPLPFVLTVRNRTVANVDS